MKKMFTRIAACSLAVLIAFGSVCYKPSNARALGVESAFAAAATYTYLESVGMSFEGTAYDGMRDSLLDIFVDLSDNFASGLGILRSDFEAIIAEGVDFLENGHVRISSAAANMLGQFSDWLIDKLGLISGGGYVPFSPMSGSDFMVIGDITLPPLAGYFGSSDYPYVLIYKQNHSYNTIFAYGFKNEPYVSGWMLRCDDSPYVRQSLCHGDASSWGGLYYADMDGSFVDVDTCTMLWSNFDIKRTDDSTTFFEGSAWGNCESSLSVSLPADYEAPPKVEEQYSMVIDTGMTFEDEQAFIDSVLAGLASGALNSTYDIEEVENRDTVVPGEVTDTQAGILSWVKTIAQRVSALPQSIAEAVKSIFVPDAALTTEITDTFASKFSFVSTLHRLGTDLLSIGPDSKPPVVYIHLEDAEGSIDYGGTVKALDMSWYQRYKEDGDRIIGGFLWLGFLWLLFKRVPAIIRGAEMISESSNDFRDNYEELMFNADHNLDSRGRPIK